MQSGVDWTHGEGAWVSTHDELVALRIKCAELQKQITAIPQVRERAPSPPPKVTTPEKKDTASLFQIRSLEAQLAASEKAVAVLKTRVRRLENERSLPTSLRSLLLDAAVAGVSDDDEPEAGAGGADSEDED